MGNLAKKIKDCFRNVCSTNKEKKTIIPSKNKTPISSNFMAPKEEEFVSSGGYMNNRDAYYNQQEIIYYQNLYKDEKIEPINTKIAHWQKGNLIGSGSFGQVSTVLNKDTGEILAVKQVPIMDAEKNPTIKNKIKAIEVEIEILSKLNHVNIVRYLGFSKDSQFMNIFLEYQAGGSIASLLQKFGHFNENIIKTYTRQILEGLDYLHAHGVIHRDIKGANVLVNSQGICKLSDFGGAKKLVTESQLDQYNSLKGTPYWMAPEVIRQERHGRQADIWSLGCTILEMATGHPPYSHLRNHFSALFFIAQEKSPPPFPKNLSPSAVDFLNQCFQQDPLLRPNTYRLLRHPFITGNDNIAISLDKYTISSNISAKEDSISTKEKDKLLFPNIGSIDSQQNSIGNKGSIEGLTKKKKSIRGNTQIQNNLKFPLKEFQIDDQMNKNSFNDENPFTPFNNDRKIEDYKN